MIGMRDSVNGTMDVRNAVTTEGPLSMHERIFPKE